MEEVSKYKIIMSDPPWRIEVWDRDTGLDRSPDIHYQTMTKDELFALPVADYAADDSVLIMWCVDCHYKTAMELGEAWGFEYNTVLFRWLKMSEDQKQLALMPIEPPTLCIAQGYTTRSGGCEEAWVFKRGKGLPVLRHDIRREFYAQRRAHSRKPDEVPGWITDIYGTDDCAEMFARTRRQGWAQIFSNQADMFK